MCRKCVLTALVLALAAACSSPMATDAATADVAFVVVFTPVGDGSGFSATLDGQGYTTPGATSVTLAPGAHSLAGTFHGSGLTISFQTIGEGGVQSNSVRSVSGPSPSAGACTITYANDTPATDRPFEIDFELDTAPANACPGPAV